MPPGGFGRDGIREGNKRRDGLHGKPGRGNRPAACAGPCGVSR
ncbi:hypothetical protein C882_1849 [Caenispirillum salinarum AK4]|uniref:Uncharacterized protein n=1 Tax=Caenispirillum salinarum AK4 TaxID=1238182 RepID=K9GQA3_9PROT|nr:hypothetical protein C882_1849 [Caenispirillum salinarum AK4]